MKRRGRGRLAALALTAFMLVGAVSTNAFANDPTDTAPVVGEVAAIAEPAALLADEASDDATDDAVPAEGAGTMVDEASDDTTAEPEATPEAEPVLAAEAVAAAAPLAAPSPAAGVDNVYLDGVKGSDDNDGLTVDTPVKTFAKAKEILGADGKTIFVTGTVTVSDTQEWSLAEGQKVVRDSSMTAGAIVKVNKGDLTLTDVTIDGGYGTTNEGVKDDKTNNSGSIVRVMGGTLNVGAGSTLQNNSVVSTATGGDYGYFGGGGVSVDGGTVNLAGTIDNCSTYMWGGGIFAENKATVNIKGGTISNCVAGFDGGGVCLYQRIPARLGLNAMTMEGGAITGCSAGTAPTATRRGGKGGGIFSSYSTVIITGGEISNNVTRFQGGGICLTDGSMSKITGENGIVTISGNVSNLENGTGDGQYPNVMGGGGIYVDGRTPFSGDTIFPVSSLYLGETVISENTATVDGGGVSVCPEGSNTIPANGTIAVFGNDTNSGNAKDAVVVRFETVTSDGHTWTVGRANKGTVSIPATMLGGGAYHWTAPDGTEFPLDALDDSHEFFGTANVSDADAQVARRAATVFITGNTSKSFGGGIACNGLMSSATSTNDETVNLTITKNWSADTETDRPESVRVNILCDGTVIGYVDVKPDEDGDWTLKVDGLPKSNPDKSHEYVYTLEEDVVTTADGAYKATYGEPEADENGNITITITNTKTLTTEFSKRNAGGDELAGAKMQVIDGDGNVVDEWVSDGRNHSLQLESGDYTLHEEIAPEGYLVATDIEFTVDSEAGTVTVKGSTTAAEGNLVIMVDDAEPTPEQPKPEEPKPEEPKPEEPKPQQPKPEAPKPTAPRRAVPNTGDPTSVAIPGIAMSGMLVTLLGYGVARRKRK